MSDEKSAEIAEITSALAAAQANMGNATLNRYNPHYRSRYADLAQIRQTVIPPLAQQGIAATQTIMPSEGGLYLVTTLAHKSGQYIRSYYPLPPNVRNQQEFGSALTYARRYSLAAMCGISAEEDDDGNAEAEGAPQTQQQNGSQSNGHAKQATPNAKQKYEIVDAAGSTVHEFPRDRSGAEQAVATLEQYAESEPSVVLANQGFLNKAAGSKGELGQRAQAVLEKVQEPAEVAE